MRAVVAAVACAAAAAACSGSKSGHPQVHVAMAADLQTAFAELGPAFQKKTGIEPIFSPNSTGVLTKQIAHGAPFDVLAAANVSYAKEAADSGACDGATITLYARGKLVVWTPSSLAPPASLADLADPRFTHVAIANPEHAPYGVAAKTALEKAGVWNAVEPRLVYGENVQQTLQFAQSGNAEAAIVSLSLLSGGPDGGKILPIDPSMHDPIDQAMIVCKNGGNVAGGKAFVDFVASPEGREIMTRYGFVPPGPAPQGASLAPAPIPEREARGLVDAWLHAQNTGDAAAYGALYAEHFTGVKRVGYRTWRYARPAWLADRAKMFRHPMQVGADQVAVRVAGPVAIVDLVQSFAQGAFKDVGPKQLIVVRTPDGLRIGREEMLASDVEHSFADAPALAFVVEVDGARYAILAETTTAPGTGELTPVRGDGPMWTFEPIDLAKAPPEVAAWKGKRVRVFDDRGGSCEAAVGELVKVAVATPHASVVRAWDDPAAPLSPTARAQALAAMVPAYLGARLDGACAGGWADLDDHDGVVFRPVDPDRDALAGAIALLRSSADWKQIQDEYETAYGGKGPWVDAEGGATEHRAFAGPDGKTAYVAVSAHAGAGCGDFEGSATALFHVSADDPHKMTLVGRLDGLPRAITDVDRDGAIEVMTDDDILLPADSSLAPLRHLDLHAYDSPC